MKKLILPFVLLAGIQTFAAQKQVAVNCSSPKIKMLAGGATTRLYGKLDLAMSPSGMMKLKQDSFLTLETTKFVRGKSSIVRKNLKVSGTYYEGSSPRIAANEEPSGEVDSSGNEVDDRTYSDITINGKNSSLFELKSGLERALICAKVK